MRVSAVGWAAPTIINAIWMSHDVTSVTHDHPEGLKGAEAIATSIWKLRHGASQEDIRQWITEHYYPLDFTIDEIRPTYVFNESCQETVPQAIEAFLEANDFEDAIRTAVSVGGDSDTLAAITGSLAEAYWGVPQALKDEADKFLDLRLKAILRAFEAYLQR